MANILGIAYILSAIAIIIPGIPWIKEWAYAGIVFAMTAAFASHVFIGDTFANMVPPLVILVQQFYGLRWMNVRGRLNACKVMLMSAAAFNLKKWIKSGLKTLQLLCFKPFLPFKVPVAISVNILVIYC